MTLADLTAQRGALLAQLAAVPAQPSVSDQGRSIDYNAMRSGLLAQLEALNKQISAQFPFDIAAPVRRRGYGWGRCW